jgi:hypothetical protein
MNGGGSSVYCPQGPMQIQGLSILGCCTPPSGRGIRCWTGACWYRLACLCAALAGTAALSSVKKAVPVSKILFMASLHHWFMTIHWFDVSRTRTFTPCATAGGLWRADRTGSACETDVCSEILNFGEDYSTALLVTKFVIQSDANDVKISSAITRRERRWNEPFAKLRNSINILSAA